MIFGTRSAQVSSGAGVRSLYVDGFHWDDKGDFILNTLMPRGAAVDYGISDIVDEELEE